MKHSLNIKHDRDFRILLGILFIAYGLHAFVSIDNDIHRIVGASLFILLGIGCISYFHRVVVNLYDNEILVHRGCLFPIFTKRYNIAKVKRVTLKEKTIQKSKNKTKTFYPIHLTGIKDAIVAKSSGLWQSRELAERLSVLIDRPMNNLVYKKSSIRKANELDTTLVDRLKKEATYPTSAPTLPDNSKLVIDRTPNEFKAVIDQGSTNVNSVIIFTSLITGILIYGMTKIQYVYIDIVIAVCAFSICYLGFVSLSFLNVGDCKLIINKDAISFRHGYYPKTFKINIKEIEEYIVVRDGAHLVGDRGDIFIYWGIHEEDYQYLEDVVPYELMRLS